MPSDSSSLITVQVVSLPHNTGARCSIVAVSAGVFGGSAHGGHTCAWRSSVVRTASLTPAQRPSSPKKPRPNKNLLLLLMRSDSRSIPYPSQPNAPTTTDDDAKDMLKRTASQAAPAPVREFPRRHFAVRSAQEFHALERSLFKHYQKRITCDRCRRPLVSKGLAVSQRFHAALARVSPSDHSLLDGALCQVHANSTAAAIQSSAYFTPHDYSVAEIDRLKGHIDRLNATIKEKDERIRELESEILLLRSDCAGRDSADGADDDARDGSDSDRGGGGTTPGAGGAVNQRKPLARVDDDNDWNWEAGERERLPRGKGVGVRRPPSRASERPPTPGGGWPSLPRSKQNVHPLSFAATVALNGPKPIHPSPFVKGIFVAADPNASVEDKIAQMWVGLTPATA
ncbi:hypothetical protein DFJ73DRAFT_773031 [Zopfochytrium polystomum]|nr:hypothetical protein DFJ73DRAFT_773031 [Zopfochytrium polystomum]